MGTGVFPLRHGDRNLVLFGDALRQLAEMFRVVASLGEILQHRVTHTPRILEPSTLNVMRQVLRGGVVQVVQVPPLVLLVGGSIPNHLDGIAQRFGENLFDREIVQNQTTLLLRDFTLGESAEVLDGLLELQRTRVDRVRDEVKRQLVAVLFRDRGISDQGHLSVEAN